MDFSGQALTTKIAHLSGAMGERKIDGESWWIARVGLLVVGLGIGAAMASMPTASAERC
jgi:hypothetical protein